MTNLMFVSLPIGSCYQQSRKRNQRAGQYSTRSLEFRIRPNRHRLVLELSGKEQSNQSDVDSISLSILTSSFFSDSPDQIRFAKLRLKLISLQVESLIIQSQCIYNELFSLNLKSESLENKQVEYWSSRKRSLETSLESIQQKNELLAKRINEKKVAPRVDAETRHAIELETIQKQESILTNQRRELAQTIQRLYDEIQSLILSISSLETKALAALEHAPARNLPAPRIRDSLNQRQDSETSDELKPYREIATQEAKDEQIYTAPFKIQDELPLESASSEEELNKPCSDDENLQDVRLMPPYDSVRERSQEIWQRGLDMISRMGIKGTLRTSKRSVNHILKCFETAIDLLEESGFDELREDLFQVQLSYLSVLSRLTFSYDEVEEQDRIDQVKILVDFTTDYAEARFQLDPQNSKYLFLLGSIQYYRAASTRTDCEEKCAGYEAAALKFNRALLMDPDNADISFNLALSYLHYADALLEKVKRNQEQTSLLNKVGSGLRSWIPKFGSVDTVINVKSPENAGLAKVAYAYFEAISRFEKCQQLKDRSSVQSLCVQYIGKCKSSLADLGYKV